MNSNITLKESTDLIKERINYFYVYIMKRPDGIPFYVGKGRSTGGTERICMHEWEADNYKGSNFLKCNIIRKIKRGKDHILYDIVLFSRKEHLCFDKERELIAWYGRVDNKTGLLSNFTNGGDGISGRIISKEIRGKISLAQKGKSRKRWTIDQKEKASKMMSGDGNPNFGKRHSKATRKMISQAAKNRKCSDTTRLKMSSAHKGKRHSEESKEKMSQSHLGLKASEETKKKLSIMRKGVKWSKERRERYEKRKELIDDQG